MDKIKLKKKFYVILIVGIIMVVSGVSYAILTIVLSGLGTQSIVSGELVLELHESQSLTLADVVPVRDETGLSSTPYTFSVENTGTIITNYSIYIDEQPLKEGETRLDPIKIKYELRSNNSTLSTGNLTGTNTLLYTTDIMPNITHNLELRLWIDFDVTELKNTDVFESKIRIEGTQEVEYRANDPELVGDMIAVKYDETLNSWVKANMSEEWYNYDKQMWANAVTVIEDARQGYIYSAAGTQIPMDDINAMFVWIPRYSYTMKDTYGYQIEGASEVSAATPGAFDIKWENTLETSFGTASYTGDNPTNWYTSSAFCWGNSCDDEVTRSNEENRELPGIWVGKFETSELIPEIKPNKYSSSYNSLSIWHNRVKTNLTDVSAMETYGLYGTFDAHISKNTEWASVAYLTQSQYGKYGNSNYIGPAKEVNPSNCVTYITGTGGNIGQGATSTTCTNTYETAAGQASSTTGNIFGVYDMVGGRSEALMANMKQSSGIPYLSTSGFTQENFPEAKYYNSYEYTDNDLDFSNTQKGDAIIEVKGFYSDYNRLFTNSTPWIQRGGNIVSGTYGGLYDFDTLNGAGGLYTTYRIIITP